MKRLIAIALIVLIVGIGGYIRSGQENVGLAPEGYYGTDIYPNYIPGVDFVFDFRFLESSNAAMCTTGSSTYAAEWKIRKLTRGGSRPQTWNFPEEDRDHAERAVKMINAADCKQKFKMFLLGESFTNWLGNQCVGCRKVLVEDCDVRIDTNNIWPFRTFDVVIKRTTNVYCNPIPTTGPSIGG